MYIDSYPDCCAFKIASGLSYITSPDIEKILRYARRLTANRSAEANNQVLLAINWNQRGSIAQIKSYIKKGNHPFKVINIVKWFLNSKSGNRVALSMVVHNEQIPKKKSTPRVRRTAA